MMRVEDARKLLLRDYDPFMSLVRPHGEDTSELGKENCNKVVNTCSCSTITLLSRDFSDFMLHCVFCEITIISPNILNGDSNVL